MASGFLEIIIDFSVDLRLLQPMETHLVAIGHWNVTRVKCLILDEAFITSHSFHILCKIVPMKCVRYFDEV